MTSSDAPADAVAAPPETLSVPRWRQVVAVVAFCVFVAGWAVVGVRGLVNDDSRWAWGMFPYVLEVKVEEVRFVDDKGRSRPWKHKGTTRVPRAVRPGNDDEQYGYGKGAYDDLIARLLVVAAKDARKNDVAVEAVVVTRRSERAVLRETVRRALR